MSGDTLDLRDIPPQERHPKIFSAFAELDSGEQLTLINDHEPRPLYFQMKEGVDEFDADEYSVEQHSENEFVATLPKQ